MIYIACLPAFATGGTELLHQFAAELIKNGAKAAMLFHKASGDPVHPRLKKYNVPYVLDIENPQPEDIIVVPEVMTDLLYEWNIQKRVIWWLSVDFYARSFFSKRNLYRRLILWKKYYRFNDPSITHFTQSQYAYEFLKNKGIRVEGHLSDYLGDDFIEQATAATDQPRRKIVLFNPKKGIEYTKKLMSLCPEIEFKAIENMTPKEVSENLRSSEVYIDFGNHPGKDRIPREAAISGCTVIFGRRGSVNNTVDVPVPDDYKFTADAAGLQGAAKMLTDVMSNPSAHRQRFEDYRSKIRIEKSIFQNQVIDFLSKTSK